jgi:hypothetical protein
MNRYLDTIDTAISAVHSKAWSGRSDSSEEYDANLLALIELRSFMESQMNLKMYVLDLGWEGARVTLADSYESAVETIHAENVREYRKAAEESPKSFYTAGLANLLTKKYPYDYMPEHMTIVDAVDGAFIQTEGE